MQNFLSNLPVVVRVLLIIFSVLSLLTLGVFSADSLVSIFQESGQQEKSEERIEVKFITRSKNSTPIEGAKVEFIFDGAPEPRFTNSDGYVSINIPKRNDIDVVISKDGFKSIRKTINLKADSDKTVEYFLEKNSS